MFLKRSVRWSFVPFALFAVYVSKRSVPCISNRERFYCLFLCVRVFRVVHGSWNLKGLSLVDLKRFEEESKESFPLPSREGTRAVKEEEALVRTVRVVRGSSF